MKARTILSASAFVLAFFSAFAFSNAKPASLLTSADYYVGTICSGSGNTVQTGCKTSNTTSPCTVAVTGNPIAYAVGTSCGAELFSQP